MIRTKLLVASLGLCAVALAAVPAIAQGPRGPGGPGGQGGGMRRPDPVARLTTELNLNAHQQAQLHTIFDGLMAQMKALPRGPESRDKRQALFQSVEPQVMQILTPAQKKKLMSNGGLRGMMGRGRGGGGAGLFEASLAKMKLSPTEKSKTSALITEMREKFKALRSGASGPPSVDQVNKMRAISDHYKKAIEAALSPQNAKEFERISATRPGGGGGQGRDPGQPGGR